MLFWSSFRATEGNFISQKPRIGVIGTGPWGQNLIRNFAIQDCLVAIGSRTPDVLSIRYPKIHMEDVKYVSIEALLADDRIDAVAIATPSTSHASLTERALRNGKHVFIEKPMTLSIADAENVEALARKHQRKVMVGHILHYHPAFKQLSEWVQSGRLGALRSINSERISRGRIRDNESVLWSFAPHDVSMILKLVGAYPEKIRASEHTRPGGLRSDEARLTLDFNDTLQANIFVSWLGPTKSQKLRVTGTKGVAVFDDVADWPRKLCFQAWPKQDADQLFLADAEWADLTPTEPLRQETAAFIETITTGKKTPSDVSEGVRVTRVLAAAEAAANLN